MISVSCAHSQKGETVAEHRNDAAIHQQKALAARSRHDPVVAQRPAPHMPRLNFAGVPDFGSDSEGPSDGHLEKADREMREANEHLVAAGKLVKSEDQACVGLPEEVRAECPVFAPSVSAVHPMPSGFALTFRPTVDVAQTLRRLRCHLAFAVAAGFDHPTCPLFVRGTSLHEKGNDGIEFVGESEAAASELLAQARGVFLGLEEAAR